MQLLDSRTTNEAKTNDSQEVFAAFCNNVSNIDPSFRIFLICISGNARLAPVVHVFFSPGLADDEVRRNDTSFADLECHGPQAAYAQARDLNLSVETHVRGPVYLVTELLEVR